MGQMTVVTCDVDGTNIAVETVTIKIGNQNLVKDLCQRHLDELTAGARQPRPGRRAGMLAGDVATMTAAVAPKRRPGRPRKSETVALAKVAKSEEAPKKELAKTA